MAARLHEVSSGHEEVTARLHEVSLHEVSSGRLVVYWFKEKEVRYLASFLLRFPPTNYGGGKYVLKAFTRGCSFVRSPLTFSFTLASHGWSATN